MVVEKLVDMTRRAVRDDPFTAWEVWRLNGNAIMEAANGLILSDGVYLWINMCGDGGYPKEFPEIRPEPFVIVGHVNREHDDHTEINALTSEGEVVRSVHGSARDVEAVVTPAFEGPRLLDDEEVVELFDYLGTHIGSE